MKTFLIKNRYIFIKYLQNLQKNSFGVFFLTPYITEVRQILKNEDFFIYQLASSFLKLIFNIKNFNLFTSLIFYISFSNFFDLLNFMKQFSLNFKKFNYSFEICFFKINNFFIIPSLYSMYKKIYEKFNSFYIYLLFLVFNIYKLFLILFFNIFQLIILLFKKN